MNTARFVPIVIESFYSHKALTQNQDSGSPSDERLERTKRFQSQFQRRELINASSQEIGQAAIDYTRARYSILSGTPQVVVSRPITAAGAAELGLPSVNFIGQEPPLMLVILKGNFDVSNMPVPNYPGSKRRTQVKYIAYLFDIRAGIPTLTATSLSGEKLRRELNDNSLPDLPQLSGADGYRPPEEIPAITNTSRPQKLPYGSVLPPFEDNSPLPPPEPPPSESQ